MDLFVQKNSIRLAMIEKRELLSPEEIRQASEIFSDQIDQLPEINHAIRLGIYAPYRNEVPTQGILQRLRQRSGEVYYPRVPHKSPTLEFVKIDQESQLVRGYLGILEPSSEMPNVPLNTLDTIFVPGVAFDRAGKRIGWGKGFYDQTLANFKGVKIGLAYDFQVVESIPAAGHDQTMDFIVTEKQVIDCQKNQ